MAKVGIITDTIACLPPEIVSEYDIRILPVALTINGKPYRDGVDISPDSFWKIFSEIREFTTAAPAPAEYIDILTDLSRTTDSMACIFVSKALSGVYEAAFHACNLFREDNPGANIEIVDSRTAAGAEGFVVEEAAQAANAGRSLTEVVQVANETIPRVKFITVMEALKYIIKSGRAPRTAYMGEIFQVKPIVGMLNNTGLVENLGRARGKEKALTKLLEIMERHVDVNQPVRVYIQYTNSIEDGEHLKELVTNRFNCTKTYFTPYTPVMSGHTGPVLAVSFYA